LPSKFIDSTRTVFETQVYKTFISKQFRLRTVVSVMLKPYYQMKYSKSNHTNDPRSFYCHKQK